MCDVFWWKFIPCTWQLHGKRTNNSNIILWSAFMCIFQLSATTDQLSKAHSLKSKRKRSISLEVADIPSYIKNPKISNVDFQIEVCDVPHKSSLLFTDTHYRWYHARSGLKHHYGQAGMNSLITEDTLLLQTVG